MASETSLDMNGLTLLLFGHSAFQYLHAGCRFNLFKILYESGPKTKAEIADLLQLSDRSIRCLLSGLTSLRLLQFTDDNYSNSSVINDFFDQNSWDIFKNTVYFEAEIAYLGQIDFVSSLKENKNQGLSQFTGTGKTLYARLGENPELEKTFYNYMSSWSRLVNQYLVKKVDFTTINRIVDVGGGDATNAITLAQAFPNLQITLIDIPSCCSIARKKIAENKLSDRIIAVEADIFSEPFPSNHDCFIFIHQLVIWSLESNKDLLTRAYNILPKGGKVVIFSSISSDKEEGPLMSALDNAYFISTPSDSGMIYSWNDYEWCLRSAGFVTIERIYCEGWTPHGILVATK